MAKRPVVQRTVQYWRLVDSRDGALVSEVDWEEILRSLQDTRRTFVIDSREHAGTVYTVEVPSGLEEAFDFTGHSDIAGPTNPSVTMGVVIAAGKDFVPNQENATTGIQKPMALDGDGWEPVDNLFVWHLPFGNMIAVLAESTSSSRAAKYADWLTRATRHRYTEDPDFAWGVHPVIDQSRAAILDKASGLRGFVYAGEIGEGVVDAKGAKAIFVGPDKTPTAIRIEIKAGLVRGKSSHEDDKTLLEWFNQTFGSLEGTVSKAQVAVSAPGESHATEVDLLHHRLTRKTQVPLAVGTTRAFTPMSALGAIVSAFGEDRTDLLRLRRNSD